MTTSPESVSAIESPVETIATVEGADAPALEPQASAAATFSGLDDAATTGQFDLEDRHSLRRIASLSTELEEVTEVEYRQLRLERVVLAGVWAGGVAADADNSLIELAALAETAGSVVLEGLVQRRSQPDPATFIGSGKVDELREVVLATGADTVICDGELSASQLRNLEDRVKVKVIDRTMLILDIFAQHAKSREGKAQVELAQLDYLSQRLRGWGDSLSRQAGGRAGGAGGGVGTRGPGETKLETDRRRIRTRMAKLRRDLAHMHTARETKRAGRRRNAVPAVAIVGYTNAGKSSLLNRLTGAGVLVEDALFATLDPTVRRAHTPDGRGYTVTDTVGFVRHLPHELVESFRSTLEEVADADLLVHVVDGSHPDPEGQLRAVRDVLTEIGAEDVPEIVAVNKIDAAEPFAVTRLLRAESRSVAVSAHSGQGVDELRAVVERELPRPPVEVAAVVPYERGELISKIHSSGEVISMNHEADGTHVRARVSEGLAAALAQYSG
ncbi:GTPase HflX [Phytoactinopolyspora limicola]|uniref:GTPase HflX n=1 Tax=Phytoactinopolyspora limicola TaxID=2715536 RepID=UPI0014086BAA|nr:GTPase HflX [Phytoactinopolyspora limicola]